jgi:hypothetical protein
LIIKQILKSKKAFALLSTANVLLASVCGFSSEGWAAAWAAGETKTIKLAANENISTDTKDAPTYTLRAKENGVQEMVLANGLKVLLLEEHSFPVVTSMVVYRVGSRNENLGETGLSHLVEHLLFEKVGRYRKGELAATIARNGGMFNGFTSDDFTVFFETLSPAKLPIALRIEADRMHSATFTAEDVQAEIKRIEKELDTEAKDAANLLNKEVRSAAFQLHPYKNPTIGWRSDVQKLTLDDVKRHYRDYYQPSNATLVIVGDFDTKAQVAQVQKYLGQVKLSHRERCVWLNRLSGRNGVFSEVCWQFRCEWPTTPPIFKTLMLLLCCLRNCWFWCQWRLKTKSLTQNCCTFEAKRDPGFSL